jgi:hypothetical protein
LVPDDNPGDGKYFTLKDVEKAISPHLPAQDIVDYALWSLEETGQLVLTGPGGFVIAFEKPPETEGLYLAFIKEPDND